MKLIENKTKFGVVFLSYPLNGGVDVGFFPDGSGVVIKDKCGNEVTVQPHEIRDLRSLLRYCESHSISQEEEKFYEGNRRI